MLFKKARVFVNDKVFLLVNCLLYVVKLEPIWVEHFTEPCYKVMLPALLANISPTLKTWHKNTLAYLQESVTKKKEVHTISTRCQFHKHFTHVTYSCSKISFLKTLHGGMHAMDSPAYFDWAVLYRLPV
jgi:hypothetical protein